MLHEVLALSEGKASFRLRVLTPYREFYRYLMLFYDIRYARSDGQSSGIPAPFFIALSLKGPPLLLSYTLLPSCDSRLFLFCKAIRCSRDIGFIDVRIRGCKDWSRMRYYQRIDSKNDHTVLVGQISPRIRRKRAALTLPRAR